MPCILELVAPIGSAMKGGKTKVIKLKKKFPGKVEVKCHRKGT